MTPNLNIALKICFDEQVLPPESIIEVLFLGLLYMKAPVTPMDLSREIFTGKLPFFKEFINVCSESDNENTFHILHPPHLKSIKLSKIFKLSAHILIPLPGSFSLYLTD